MVFLYSGEFRVGGTYNHFQYLQYLAELEDVVVVTINNRINIFGYSGAPNASQNVGFLDARLAIERLRDNIASFGRDSKRITPFDSANLQEEF
ncbi:alpha/beta-hydrolase [Acephala macrosclerotiorum]|nr:alpha/beta-hydrolase [Acephala macrosclerotiorum]